MTQTQSVTAETCDHFLRQGREFLAQGDLASASAAGWQAAVIVMANYAGSGAEFNFTDAAQRLVKDHRGHAAAAEWVVSAMALSDNAGYDWLDSEGVARRLDDVQRLAILVKDIAEPPQSAEDVLRRAWECLGNGYLIPASDKGWEAASADCQNLCRCHRLRLPRRRPIQPGDAHFWRKRNPGSKEQSADGYMLLRIFTQDCQILRDERRQRSIC